MEKPQKVKEPKYYDSNGCGRCDQYYCVDCVDFETIEFDVEENANENRPDLKPYIQNWKGEDVCPWCYNQLIDKAFPLTTPHKK